MRPRASSSLPLTIRIRSRGAAFSPDGARILTASVDKTAKLWDAATPLELARQVKESGGDTARRGSSVSMANFPALQVESLSAIASGLQFSDDGSLVVVDEERRSKLRKQSKDLAQDPVPTGASYGGFSVPAVIERSSRPATSKLSSG